MPAPVAGLTQLVDAQDFVDEIAPAQQGYKDPMTAAGTWKTLPSPPDPVQGIYGVASTSDEEPFKQGNFPEVIKSFEGKKKYSEWEFIYKKTPAGAPGAGRPGVSTPGAAQTSFPLSTPEGE